MTTTNSTDDATEAWAALAQALVAAHKDNDEFMAFVQPLKTKLRRLFDELGGQEDIDLEKSSWIQPGFYVAPPSFGRPGMHVALHFVSTPQMSLVVDDLGQEGITLTGCYRDEIGAVQVRLNLNAAFHQQSDLAQTHWKTCFSNAPFLVESALASFEYNRPLQSELTWSEVLCSELENEGPRDYDPLRWSRWLEKYGTPQMQADFDMSLSLFELPRDHAAWKTVLLAHWCNTPILDVPFIENDWLDLNNQY